MQRASPDFRLQYGMTRAPIYRKARLGYYLSTREELRVRQIRFSSPGLVSFEGIGEVIKELRETLDYILTGVWVRNFLNIYYEVRSRELRKAENDARLSEANARSAEARAREAEANVRYLEARSRIKMAISQSIQDNKPRSSVEIIGISRIDGIANIGIQLEAQNLANQFAFEDAAIDAISRLNRLSYEQQKLQLGTERRVE